LRRWAFRLAIGALGGAGVLGLIAAGLYRAYGPGDLAERLARFVRRWQPFLDPPNATILQIWRFIGQGLLLTLQVAVISIALSLVFGIVLALMRLARNPQVSRPSTQAGRIVRMGLSAPSTVLVQSIRSSPLFMLIIYTFLAAPRLGLDLSALASGIFALTVYTSCVLAEILRAGILSLDRGQFEAADALGLSYFKKLRFVVLPQALRRMVPALVSQLITLIKDTSLISLIGVIELFRRFNIMAQLYFNPIEAFLVAGSIYFVINLSLSRLARRLEILPSRVGHAADAAVQGIGSEDQTLLVTEKA
jgi:His/Glu/Gln/Arg/opine family amino acid ABC transporter permease subunit